MSKYKQTHINKHTCGNTYESVLSHPYYEKGVTLSLTHSLTQYTLSHTDTNTHAHTRTHSHTHTLTQTHTCTHTQPHGNDSVNCCDETDYRKGIGHWDEGLGQCAHNFPERCYAFEKTEDAETAQESQYIGSR